MRYYVAEGPGGQPAFRRSHRLYRYAVLWIGADDRADDDERLALELEARAADPEAAGSLADLESELASIEARRDARGISSREDSHAWNRVHGLICEHPIRSALAQRRTADLLRRGAGRVCRSTWHSREELARRNVRGGDGFVAPVREVTAAEFRRLHAEEEALRERNLEAARAGRS